MGKTKHISVTVERARKEIENGNRDRVQRTVCRSSEDVVHIWVNDMRVKITNNLQADAATSMDKIFVIDQSRSEVMRTLNCEELAIFNYGLILHEMFHLFYSPSIKYVQTVIGRIENMTAMAKKRFPNLVHYSDRLDRRFLFHFINAIEDAHIERRGKLNFPKFIMPIDFMNMIYRRYSKAIRDEADAPVRVNAFVAVLNFTLQFAVYGKKPDLEGIDEELAKTLVSAKRLILEAVYENDSQERPLKALDILDAIIDQIVTDDEEQDREDSSFAGRNQEQSQNSSQGRPSQDHTSDAPNKKIQKPQKKKQRKQQDQSKTDSESQKQESPNEESSESEQQEPENNDKNEIEETGAAQTKPDSQESDEEKEENIPEKPQSQNSPQNDCDDNEDSEEEPDEQPEDDSDEEPEDDFDEEPNNSDKEPDDSDEESDDDFDEEDMDEESDDEFDDDLEDESDEEADDTDDQNDASDEESDDDLDNSESEQSEGTVSDEEIEAKDPDPDKVKSFMENLVRAIQKDLLNEETENEENRSLRNTLKGEPMPDTELAREYNGCQPPLSIKIPAEETLPKEVKRLVEGYASRICRKVEEEVKTRTEGGVLPYQLSGRFNSSRIMDHVIRTGADRYRLFDQEIEGEEGLDICVEILVDESGSMDGNRENTIIITDILYETCKKLGIPVRVATFTERTYLLCDFEEACTSTFDRRLAAYDPDDGTNEAQALLLLENSLLKRPEKNKYLFLITDGCPGFYCEEMHPREWLNKYQRYAIKKGIQMIACCTGCSAETVAEIYDGPKIVYNDYPKLVKRLTDEFLRPLKT